MSYLIRPRLGASVRTFAIEGVEMRSFVCAAVLTTSVGAAGIASAQNIFGSVVIQKRADPSAPVSLEVGSSVERELGKGDTKVAFRAAEYFRFSSRPDESLKLQIAPKDRPVRVLVRRGSAHGPMALRPQVIEVDASPQMFELPPGEDYVLAVISKHTGSAGRYTISLFSDGRPLRIAGVALPFLTPSGVSAAEPSSRAEAAIPEEATNQLVRLAEDTGTSRAEASSQQRIEPARPVTAQAKAEEDSAGALSARSGSAQGRAEDENALREAQGDRVYAYCTVQELPSRQWFTTKVFTIRVDGLQLGGEVPTRDVLVASYMPNDLQGQFMKMVELGELNRDSANCYAAGSMTDLKNHYGYGKSRAPMQKGRFAEWDPKGDFFIGSELWPN